MFCIRNLHGQETSFANQFLPEDGRFNFIELSQKYGYPAEEYNVTTDDGYILRIFRIPGKREARPLLVMHGILESSDTWIIRGNSSLAVTFAALGYDLWFPNVRGNRYSRQHVRLNPDLDPEFWDYSIQEHGYYDLSAAIDLILNKTGAEKLSAIAYSQGNTIFYILTSTRPEYNSKIHLLIALAPVSYLNNVGTPLSTLINLSPIIYRTSLTLGVNEVFGDKSTVDTILKLFCPLPVIGYGVCIEGFIFPLAGRDVEELEASFIPILIGHFPTGTSLKNLYHFGQIGLRKRFAQFDYGIGENLLLYNSETPPQYDLEKVNIKVALFVAKNDAISTIPDVDILKDQLPDVVQYYVNERAEYNHADYPWARNNDKLLYPQIKKVLDENP
ncbi:unnamed protein product, partial [Iphiclides podalirius]